LNELLLGRFIRTLNWRRISNIIKTSAAFTFSTISGKTIVWGVPPVLTIEPTNLCNLKCPLCTTGSGDMKRIKGQMSVSTFKTIMDKVGEDICFLLIYHQGEPLMNKNFYDFVRMAKEKNIYVTTSTNGHYFTPKNVANLIDCGLDSMIVSIDGTTQESYEKYRVGGSLKRVIEGSRLLMQERKKRRSRTPNVAVQFLVMKHNESEIDSMRRLVKDIGVDRFLVKNIEVHSVAEAREWLPHNPAFRRYNFDGKNYRVKNDDQKYCSRPWASTLVNWDGTIVPCCFDKNAHHPMGNIRDPGHFGDIWFNGSYTSFRNKMLTNRNQIDICRNCNQGFKSFLPSRIWKKRIQDQVSEESEHENR
jgi:radical SAM protein with 4Fe4S-binding SPASM domain